MTGMLKAYANEFDDIVKQVENKTGYIFDESEVREVFAYTLRKCEINGKGSDYVPILFENELRDYLMRAYINIKGEQNRRARLASQPVMA